VRLKAAPDVPGAMPAHLRHFNRFDWAEPGEPVDGRAYGRWAQARKAWLADHGLTWLGYVDRFGGD
jgi:hypothetical protein